MVHLAQLLNLPPKIYDQSICKHLKRDSGPTALAGLEQLSLIACTARSGSSLVLDCLEQYGFQHYEPVRSPAAWWLNTDGTIKRAVDAGEAASLTEYGDYMARWSTNGRFDMKGTFSAFLFLYEIQELPEHKDAWRFIHLRRSNVVRQAISNQLAVRTGQWTKQAQARGQVADDDYSFDKIAKSMASIIQQHANIEKAFALLELEPLRITYEEFVRDISGNTWKLARHIGLDVPDEPIEIRPTMERQSNDVNARWEARFREDLEATLRER